MPEWMHIINTGYIWPVSVAGEVLKKSSQHFGMICCIAYVIQWVKESSISEMRKSIT